MKKRKRETPSSLQRRPPEVGISVKILRQKKPRSVCISNFFRSSPCSEVSKSCPRQYAVDMAASGISHPPERLAESYILQVHALRIPIAIRTIEHPEEPRVRHNHALEVSMLACILSQYW